MLSDLSSALLPFVSCILFYFVNSLEEHRPALNTREHDVTSDVVSKPVKKILLHKCELMCWHKTGLPGLLTGEGGRKLAGMDLRRSFCRATMKGSLKCSR